MAMAALLMMAGAIPKRVRAFFVPLEASPALMKSEPRI